MLRDFLKEQSIDRKDFFIVFILLFNTFAWNFMTPIMIRRILSLVNVTTVQNFVIWVAYYLSILGSSIVGSILSDKTSRLNFLYVWIFLGAVTSLLPALINNLLAIHVSIIGILLGVSFGLGMPSCLAYFAECTLVKNRGTISGTIFLITNLNAALLLIPLEVFDLTITSIIFAVWRAFGLVIFFLKPEEKFASKMKRDISFASILRDKPFVLYFTAWFMFCFIDRLGKPVMTPVMKYSTGDFYHFMAMIGPVIGSLSAFIAGFLSDQVGRKRIVLYGFVTLGIVYAIIGIAPSIFASWCLYVAINGISTGILWVSFILILWGDLSESGAREKYYVIGGIPYFLTLIIGLLSTPYVTLIPEISAFSLAAFFLFLAVLPLLYAPETLSERKIELRRLTKYVEKARKIEEKYREKAAEG